MRWISVESWQQGGNGWRGQEGAARAGEGGCATVVTKGFWVVAVDERGVAAHRGGLCGRIDIGRKLLGGCAKVCIGYEGTSHAVVAGQHVWSCQKTFVIWYAKIMCWDCWSQNFGTGRNLEIYCWRSMLLWDIPGIWTNEGGVVDPPCEEEVAL